MPHHPGMTTTDKLVVNTLTIRPAQRVTAHRPAQAARSTQINPFQRRRGVGIEADSEAAALGVVVLTMAVVAPLVARISRTHSGWQTTTALLRSP
jgi:hypothetical protein